MTRPLELANQYMQIFYGTQSLGALYDLFADNLLFKGPFFEFDSAIAYIESLRADPPKDCEVRIIKAYEDDDSACLVYEFVKPGVTTLMSQLFEIENGKICKILLVFDTAAFK